MDKHTDYDYLSQLNLNQETYSELSLVTYASYSKLLFGVIGLSTIMYIYQLIFSKDYAFLAYNSALLFVLVIFLYFFINRSVRKNYTTNADIKFETIFSDNMHVTMNEDTSADYEYADVISIKETNTMYLLQLPNNFCIMVNKVLSCSETDSDFTNYILQKCTNLKKKQIINIANGKKTFLSAMKVQGILFAISFVIYVVTNVI